VPARHVPAIAMAAAPLQLYKDGIRLKSSIHFIDSRSTLQRNIHTSPTMSQQTQQSKYAHLPLSTSGPEDCALTVPNLLRLYRKNCQAKHSQGHALLTSPYHNKGSAFPSNERKEFSLYGLLPPNVQTLEEQIKRAYEQYSSLPDALAKNTFM